MRREKRKMRRRTSRMLMCNPIVMCISMRCGTTVNAKS